MNYKVGDYLVINEKVVDEDHHVPWVGTILRVVSTYTSSDTLRASFTFPESHKNTGEGIAIGFFEAKYLQKASDEEVLMAKLLGLI